MSSKPIPGASMYQATTNGEILRDGKVLKPVNNGYGYKKVSLWVYGVFKQKYIHRLVAETFLGLVGSLQVNHKDGDKSNNCLTNLEVVTAKQNTAHALKNGLRTRNIKTLTQIEKTTIKNLLSAGISTAVIANKFGRSQRCIQYLAKKYKEETKETP